MQKYFPIFPADTKLINSNIGVFEKDDFVYYSQGGKPLYCHAKDDMNTYRYITGTLVVMGLCKPIEIARALGTANRNIQRYAKAVREKGISAFIDRPEKRGDCHKMTKEKMQKPKRCSIPFTLLVILHVSWM